MKIGVLLNQSKDSTSIRVPVKKNIYSYRVPTRIKRVWISQLGSGLEMRQCTLPICVRQFGTQSRLGIIFRGTGKRINQDECNAWHKEDVDVFFQENAWANTEMSLNKLA